MLAQIGSNVLKRCKNNEILVGSEVLSNRKQAKKLRIAQKIKDKNFFFKVVILKCSI